jgi:hypothetical protein
LPKDIAVIGSGAAGIAAAISSARAGADTLIFDSRPAPGGTGGFSGLTTLCGLYDDAGNFLNDGFVREFTEALADAPSPGFQPPSPHPMGRGQGEGRPMNPIAPVRMGKVFVLPYRPEKFRSLAEKLISTTPNLRVQWNTPLADVVIEDGRITRLNGIEVGAVIDCSGTAEVARAVSAETFATDETTQASAVIFALCKVWKPLSTAADMAQVLLPLARAGFPPLNLQAGFEPDTFTAKFAGHVEQVPQLIAFLRANVRGFENCETSLDKITTAHRAGRMIVGQYVLTGEDVLAGRKFPDAVASCAWPIEQWDAKGAVRFQYLPLGTHYEIPARSLRAAHVKNLFMAGKTISADVDAIASARVMGCCLATGAAAGNLAADYLKSSPLR